jgi:hypothetical protein
MGLSNLPLIMLDKTYVRGTDTIVPIKYAPVKKSGPGSSGAIFFKITMPNTKEQIR